MPENIPAHDALLPLSTDPYLPVELRDTLESAHAYFLDQHAASTKKAYLSDWRIFETWCREFNLIGLPAEPGVVALFLAAEADKGTKYATINRRVAAIKYAHKLARLESPTTSMVVQGTLKGIRRKIGIAQTKKSPATVERIMAMVSSCPDTLRGKRDGALLLFGFAGAFRRSELANLLVSDLESVSEGYRVTIRQSKTDQEGAGQIIAIPNGAQLRVAEAMKAWLSAASIASGSVFRSINKAGRVGKNLSEKSVALIVKQYALKAGLDPDYFAGHSLRAGFLTTAAERGATLLKMVEVSRHRSLDTVRGYVRSADLFKGHAGEDFL